MKEEGELKGWDEKKKMEKEERVPQKVHLTTTGGQSDGEAKRWQSKVMARQSKTMLHGLCNIESTGFLLVASNFSSVPLKFSLCNYDRYYPCEKPKGAQIAETTFEFHTCVNPAHC
jgi:hypothetical protein